jgi:NadR type nicotinamide-nucleotide adenylyltransferase
MEKKSKEGYGMKKIVVIGPESTGKSSLCKALADHYHTSWCEEYARQYLEKNGKEYNYDDLLRIAKGQLELEDTKISEASHDLYFIDTNMYVMQVWCEYVFHKCHQFIIDKIVDRKYDLYLLCNVDLPWSFDELREYPDEQSRQELYRYYKELMINQTTPWVKISGNYQERLGKAIEAVDRII